MSKKVPPNILHEHTIYQRADGTCDVRLSPSGRVLMGTPEHMRRCVLEWVRRADSAPALVRIRWVPGPCPFEWVDGDTEQVSVAGSRRSG